jgi:hypothetical protein
MPKSWDQMTDVERVDDLRRDVIRIFAALQGLDNRMAFLGQNLGQVERIATRAAAAVEELKVQQSTEDDETGA